MPWSPSADPRTRARWRGRVKAQLASGKTVKAFAESKGYSAWSLYRWRSWVRRQEKGFEEVPALVEVRVADPDPPTRRAAMVVELRCGHRLVLESDFDVAAVSRLVALLEAR